ncbi:pyridoxal phosphate-dependent aminotransferase [Desulfobacula sp.]|uniref:pyridoxal phosphate-dependent aminotransferase n=1 Tax=Desulfobacula sp. TaxID=2593537 RepID=UPI002630B352|nr:pyridoxal phosphate-dependent aminotransferase [Desulfobacula sp.]
MNPDILTLQKINPIIKETESSPIRDMMKRMEETPDLINLASGEANFDASPELIENAVEAMKTGRNRYTSTNGTPEIRSAIASFLDVQMGVAVNPENILLTVGGMEAIYLATRLLINPGDTVLLPDPGWGIMKPITQRLGAKVRFYPLSRKKSWHINAEPILERIDDQCKLIVINSPSNPTGATITREAYAAILEKARRHGTFILSDEVYHNYLYSGEHVSALSFDALDHVIVVNSFSKTFAVTGWRLGYVIAHPWVIRQMGVYKETISLCSYSVGQWAMAQYLPRCQPYLDDARNLCRRNMEKMVERLNAIPGVKCPVPQGGIYVFPDFSEFEPSADKLFQCLLDSGVAVVPGPFFGVQGESHARIMFAASEEIIDRGLDRMEAALNA